MRTELFVIAIANATANTVKYAGLNADSKFEATENPFNVKSCFSHDDAVGIVKAMRAHGLAEGETIRVKSLAQSIRDYSWLLLCAAKETKVAGEKKVKEIVNMYPVSTKEINDKKTTKKVVKKTETKAAKKAA